METAEKLKTKARNLPQKPGCYLMLNKKGEILYIGKAKNLKNRVTSYFSGSSKSPKTEVLVGHIVDFDFILTDSDTEAFILENNLIKKHAPKYNVMLKDDKSYPYVVIDLKEPFPRPLYSRRPQKKPNQRIYGPFVHGTQIGEVLRTLIKLFQLRDCSLREFNSRKSPCLLYQMHHCSAPCTDFINPEDYQSSLEKVIAFFEGQGEEVLAGLRELMMSLAEEEKYERAALIRDGLEVLENFLQATLQKNTEFLDTTVSHLDVVAFYEGSSEVDVSIYMVRGGLLLGHKNVHFLVADSFEETAAEVQNFLFQYYQSTVDTLPEVLVADFPDEERQSLSEALAQSLHQKIKIRKPRGRFKSIYQLTQNNAQETQRVRLSYQQSVFVGLKRLQELLQLKERPRLLECYDVAIWQGKDPTASQIVFQEGKPQKSRYRYYHLKERPEGNNDFAMLQELVARRFEKNHFPDVLIIDGGKGQMNSVRRALQKLKIEVPVVGIAKEKSRYKNDKNEGTQERLYLPGRANPYFLHQCPPLMRLLVHMRDEAHRFSRKLHHKAHQQKMSQSWVDQVPGLGPKAKEKILSKTEFSPQELESWSLQQLKDYFQLTPQGAKNLHHWLSQQTP